YINYIFSNYINKFCTAYINNILIYLLDFLKYKNYIRKVVKRLEKIYLQVNVKKNNFTII
ncbi:hypothetical protein BS50DRAFT_490292, partial [Corynespora cassiicola Philippines]